MRRLVTRDGASADLWGGKFRLRLVSLFSLRRLFLVYSLPLLVCISLLSVFNVFQRPDLFFLDRAFQWRGAQEPGDEIAIVAISQEDFERGAPRWPWPRSLVARLIDQVSEHQPAVIAVDILYTEKTNSEAVITREQFADIQPFLYQVLSGTTLEIQTAKGTRVIGPGAPGFDQIVAGANSARAQDLELANAVQRAVDNGVRVVLAANTISNGGQVGLAEPYSLLASAAGDSLGLVGVRVDGDGVLRRYLPYGRDQNGEFVYGLSLVAVTEFTGVELPERPLPNGHVPLGEDLLVKVTDGRFLVNFRGPSGTYPTYIARDVLKEGGSLSGGLRGKIVFIGVTDPSAEDLYSTPLSGSGRMAGVEFHAAAADTLLSGTFIREAPRYQQILALAFLGLVAIALGRFLRPLFGLAGVLATVGALFGLWIGSFAGANYFLPIAAPLAGVFAGYGFAIADRVGVERLEKQQARSMLSRYLHPGIVKEMLKSSTAAQLGGTRAELTVLFSDIRGFTSISERLSPEEVVSLLNEYLSVMTEVIFKYEGTVDKFEGDAILAFFGAPQAHQDDPLRAVRTAIDMRDRLEELQDSWIGRTETPLRIGIGINTGQAVVGNIGSHRRMDYTIIGDAVNLAARLQDLTKEYGASILISGSTKAAVEHRCQLRSLGSIEVRGRRQPVDLYEVIGLTSDAPNPAVSDRSSETSISPVIT